MMRMIWFWIIVSIVLTFTAAAGAVVVRMRKNT